MPGFLDVNDLSSRRQTGYFIVQSPPNNTNFATMPIYRLSGAQLITAVQARIVLVLRTVPRERVAAELARLRAESRRSVPTFEQITTDPYTDGAWGPLTTAGLYAAASLIGYPGPEIASLAQAFATQRLDIRSVKTAIHLAYLADERAGFAQGVPARAAELRAALDSIVLRFSGVNAEAVTSGLVLPIWNRRTAVDRSLPVRATLASVLTEGVSFTPAAPAATPATPAATTERETAADETATAAAAAEAEREAAYASQPQPGGSGLGVVLVLGVLGAGAYWATRRRRNA